MIGLLFLCAVVVFLLASGLYGYKIAFYASNKQKHQGPIDLTGTPHEVHKEQIGRLYREVRDRECETVTIVSRDGLLLSGRYYHVRDGAPLDIGFHGYRSSAFTDFIGGNELSILWDHNLLLVDQRAHGNSEGHSITFGIKERHDVASWVDYALERFGEDTKILLYGVSMGAATVLMASELDLPENVKAIVADCPFSSPLDVILHVGKTTHMPAWLVKLAAYVGARVFAGFDLLETDGAQAVKNAKVPILILHGEADDYVPCTMSQAPALANPQLVQRHTFPGAGHAMSYLVDKPRYHRIVTEFVQKALQ